MNFVYSTPFPTQIETWRGSSHPLETLVDHGGLGVFETTGVATARIARRPDGSLCPQGCVFWGSSAAASRQG